MSEAPEGPGQVLRAEREALGVSTRDVAETLNLAISVVEAIEADDYERMPSPVFARGYIRSYARLLGLEPEPIVARYPQDVGSTDADQPVRRPGVAELLRRHPLLPVAGAGLVLLVVLVLLLILLWPEAAPRDAQALDARGGAAASAQTEAEGTDAEGTDAEGVFAGTGPTEVVDSALAAEVETRPGALNPDAAQPVADVGDDGDGPVAAGTVLAEASAAPAVSATGSTAAGSGVQRITELGDDQLVFDFSEDCWVEVKSATGRRLYGDLSRGGETLTLLGEGPFRILLGYAPGAQLRFNGEPVPLAPHTRNNMATLVVGQ